MRSYLTFSSSNISFVPPGPQSAFVRADEDEIDEDDGVVEDEGGAGGEEEGGEEGAPGGGDMKKNVSPDADTTLLFTKPATGAGPAISAGAGGASSSVELPAGQIVEFLVGFANKGQDDFVLETLDASFRYPMDFSFHIQNFSAIAYQKTVKPGQEATVAYSFIPADAFAGRPIGLTVNLAYRDSEGNFFFDPVFNETVQIVEFDEGFDTEVFFMYVMMTIVGILGLFLIYTFLSGELKLVFRTCRTCNIFIDFSFTPGKSKGKKPSSAPKPVETGTANDDVDYEWIPRSALRTPGSNKTSPRQRKGKRAGAGSDTE